MTAARAFAALHRADAPLRLHNAWDALSARLIATNGASAIATSSAAIAWSLGYKDGEHLPLDEHIGAVARMARVVELPISVDFERGYSDDPEAVSAAALRLVQAGACGVNLEDRGGDPALLAAKIRAVRARLGDRIFINARCCNPELDLIARAGVYENAGADGFFAFKLGDIDRIRALVKATPLPINLVHGPLVDGVRRYSEGPYPALMAYSTLRADLTYPLVNGLF